MQSGRGDGVSVIIKTQAYVDKNGKECNPLERLLTVSLSNVRIRLYSFMYNQFVQ